MKDNPGKIQFIILGPSDGKCFILKINATGIRNTNQAELLGLTIDHKLKFDPHIDKLCITARFAVQTLLWSLEFVILTNLEHDTIAVSNLARS